MSLNQARVNGGVAWLLTRVLGLTRLAGKACIPLKHHRKDPIYPSLRANPFLKVTDLFCRLPLPTLLYGPEAARLGDLLRLWVRAGVRLSLCFSFFKDSGEYAGRLGRQGALPAN